MLISRLTLARSDPAGHPIEFFNPDALSRAGVTGVAKTTGPYTADIISRRASANGVFGMKLHSDQFAGLMHQIVNEETSLALPGQARELSTPRFQRLVKGVNSRHALP